MNIILGLFVQGSDHPYNGAPIIRKCAPLPRFDVERRVPSTEERRDRWDVRQPLPCCEAGEDNIMSKNLLWVLLRIKISSQIYGGSTLPYKVLTLLWSKSFIHYCWLFWLLSANTFASPNFKWKYEITIETWTHRGAPFLSSALLFSHASQYHVSLKHADSRLIRYGSKEVAHLIEWTKNTSNWTKSRDFFSRLPVHQYRLVLIMTII